MVHVLPNRSDLARAEKLAKRMLKQNKLQKVRVLAKAYLWITNQLDQYVESVYPCFDVVEDEMRKNHCLLDLDPDGIFRLRDPRSGKVIITGTSLRDLFLNAAIWKGDWPSHEEFREMCADEDEAAGLEPILLEDDIAKFTKDR